MDRKNGIDLFRLIGAFFIMFLHVYDYGKMNTTVVENVRLLARWAVPFYFMTSGYFIGLKINNNILDFKNIQKNISMLLTIMIISSAVYLPVNTFFSRGISFYDIDHIFAGTYFHLWFIGSLIFGYVFIWYIYFIKKSKLLPFFSVFILLCMILADSYDQFFDKVLKLDLYMYLGCIPFLYLGIYFSKISIDKINKLLLFILIIIGIIIQIIESMMFEVFFAYSAMKHQFLIGTLIFSLATFLFSLKLNIQESLLTKWGKEHSLFIYIYHPIAFVAFSIITKKIFINPSVTTQLIIMFANFVIIMVIPIVLKRYFNKIYKIINGKL